MDAITPYVDPIGLSNIAGNQINPATEDTLSSLLTQGVTFAGLAIPESDAVYVTYPTNSEEVYTFKLNGVTVVTVTVDYTDSTKATLLSAVIS